MRVDRIDRTLRIFVTILVYSLYVGMVFFTFRGNWEFLFTFDYYWTTGSTTALSLFLRWLYSDTGVEVELNKNEKIRAKEKAKGEVIKLIDDNNLYDLLKVKIDKKNEESKLEEYKNLCDRKIKYYRIKSWYKLFRKNKLDKWRDKRLSINKEDFNINTIKIKYYKYDIDEMLCSFYKENKDYSRVRKTKNQKVINSAKANFFTVLSIAILKGADLLRQDFTWEALMILGGQLISFTLNIYTGYKIGKDFIKEDYSQNLTDDFVFLKTFVKEQGLTNQV